MMKYATVLCTLLAIGQTDGFAPNPHRSRGRSDRSSMIRPTEESSSRASKRISSSRSLPTTRLDLLQSSSSSSSGADRESTASTAMPSSSTSLSSSALTTSSNETASSEAPPLETRRSADNLPGWFEPVAWRAVIVVLCALWASNFAAAKLVMAEPGVDSSLYALSRFGVAAASLAPFAIRSVLRGKADGESDSDTETPVMDRETLRESIVCGSWVAFGYLGQTLGLLSTTASKSCVICSMHCVFVALVAEVWRVRKAASVGIGSATFDAKRLVPAVVAVIGVAIVELQGAGGSPTIGDALSFAQPVGFGMGYLILENIMARKPEAALPVSAVKLFVVTAASFLMFEGSPLLHGGSLADLAPRLPDFSPILHSTTAMGGILYTGLVTTALALWVESIAFAKVPATDASLILTTEPIFAAGCGAIALGETFGASDYVGASLIVGACALSVFLDSPEAESAQWDFEN